MIIGAARIAENGDIYGGKAGDKVSVYGRSRGSNYYAYVGQLTIIEA